MLNTIDSNEPTLFHARSRDLEEDSSSNMMVSRPLAEVRTWGSEVDGGAGPRRPSVSRPRRRGVILRKATTMVASTLFLMT